MPPQREARLRLPPALPARPSGSPPAYLRSTAIGSSSKSVELRDPFVQVGEADVRRVQVGILVVQRESDIFGLVPGKFWHQILVPFRAPRTAVFIMFSASVMVALIQLVDLVADQQMIVAMVNQQQFVDGAVDRRRAPLRSTRSRPRSCLAFSVRGQDRVGFHARFANLTLAEILFRLLERFEDHRLHLLVGQAVGRLHVHALLLAGPRRRARSR